jgi:hypothetical protein
MITWHRTLDGRRRIALWLSTTELLGFTIGKERQAPAVDSRFNPCCQQLVASYGASAVIGLQVRCPTCREILELTRPGWTRRPF